ncbi:MAG: hypothetical protein JWP09_947 [Candidatus Taylorbacteria bacterium]|nr:hypothetical protein [Candidatus Taylorbacteria bacterium]
MATSSIWKPVEDATRQALVEDTELHQFLTPLLADKEERKKFIKKCLRKLKTRRMLLRAQWYLDIADDQELVRQNRPALKIIFLIALAEAVTKMKTGRNAIGSFDAIKRFFAFTSEQDKEKILLGFTRTLLSPKHHSLRFSSILRILYEIRNQAVHGEDYYSFSLPNEADKIKRAGYTDWGFITSSSLGKKGKKRRISLDISLTYEELRDIVRRTAIANIQDSF